MKVQLIDGQTYRAIPYTGTRLDGRSVSNFRALPEDELYALGWRDLVPDALPSFDSLIEHIVEDGYTFDSKADVIRQHWKVESILSEVEQKAALYDQLVDSGVVGQAVASGKLESAAVMAVSNDVTV